MVDVNVRVNAPVAQVFAVLADGWAYANWVVGASHIRDVDSGWPNPGTRIHHSVGPWPLTMRDTTTVRSVDPPHLLELEAGLWPLGSASIRLELVELADDVTEIRMAEEATGGPGRLAPDAVQALLLGPRNRESLARLADLAVGRYGKG